MTFANRNRGGTGVYARSLLQALRALPEVDASEISGPPRSGFAGTVRWLTWGARRDLETKPCDILHCPSFVAPWGVRLPFVITVHDAGSRKFPADHPLEWRLYDRMILGRRLRAAARVITGSRFARAELVEAYGVQEDRVAVISYGVDSRFLDVEHEAIDLEGATMLFPGAPVPRKNIGAVLQCMAAADPAGALGGARLEISGARPEDHPQVVSLIESFGLQARVRWLGHLPAYEMPSVIARSSVVVYPSLSEGFGFPVLEALAVGTPVVCSNRGSLPEVTGDAGLLVDPTDGRALADAIQAVLTNPELRGRLRAAGRERAREFTWKRCAEVTFELYRSVVSEVRA